jgi:RNA polymerase sigma factor (sigma-70 family)
MKRSPWTPLTPENFAERVDELTRLCRWTLFEQTTRSGRRLRCNARLVCRRLGMTRRDLVQDLLLELWRRVCQKQRPSWSPRIYLNAVSFWRINRLLVSSQNSWSCMRSQISSASGSRSPEEQLEHAVYVSQLREALQHVCRTLVYRQQGVLELRYGLKDGNNYDLNQTGRIFKVTRERIRQIEAEAIRKLQRHARAVHLRSFAPQHLQTSTYTVLLSTGEQFPLKNVTDTTAMEVARDVFLERLLVGIYDDNDWLIWWFDGGRPVRVHYQPRTTLHNPDRSPYADADDSQDV